jgi:hypothetical protein
MIIQGLARSTARNPKQANERTTVQKVTYSTLYLTQFAFEQNMYSKFLRHPRDKHASRAKTPELRSCGKSIDKLDPLKVGDKQCIC